MYIGSNILIMKNFLDFVVHVFDKHLSDLFRFFSPFYIKLHTSPEMNTKIDLKDLEERTLRFLTSSCSLSVEKILLLKQIQDSVKRFNGSFEDSTATDQIPTIHAIVHIKRNTPSQGSNSKDSSRIVSLASPEFTVGLHHKTPLHELLCTSIANTFHIASHLFKENQCALPSSSHLDDETIIGDVPISLEQSKPCWLDDSSKYREHVPRIIRISTITMQYMLSLEPKYLRDCYLNFVASFRDNVQTSQALIRYPYVTLTPPWILSSSVFIYGSDDEQTIPIESDVLPNKRDIRGAKFKICGALLCAFY